MANQKGGISLDMGNQIQYQRIAMSVIVGIIEQKHKKIKQMNKFKKEKSQSKHRMFCTSMFDRPRWNYKCIFK